MKKEIVSLPTFKYSPHAYEIDVFEEEEGVCSVCEKSRSLRYIGSFYSVETPAYICPWCIKTGEASKKYKGEFNDYLGIEGVSPDPNDAPPKIDSKHLLELTCKTPSYNSIQQEVWLIHCGEPCAFIGYGEGYTIHFKCVHCGEDRVHTDCD